MYGDAIKTFDQLTTFATGVMRLRALRKAMDAAFIKGDMPDLLLEYARKAEKLADYDRLEMARVIDDRGRAFNWAGRGEGKIDLADYNAALQVFEEENSLADVAEALWRSGIVSMGFNDLLEKGLCELLRSAAIFRELGDTRKEIEAILYTGQGLSFNGLPECKRQFANVLGIGEKLGAFGELAHASILLAYWDEQDENLAEALSRSLKALEYCKKTDAYWTHAFVYQYLGRLYSKLGDLKRAEEFLDKLNKMPPEILSHIMIAPFLAESKVIYLAAHDQWEESNPFFEKVISISMPPGFEITNRLDYALTLERQGRLEEAKVQQDRVKRLLDKIEERFGHANLQLSTMVPREVPIGEEFEMRFDLVNIGRKLALLAKIAGVAPCEFSSSNLPSSCSLQNGSFVLKDKSVGPFEVEIIKLKFAATKTGNYVLNPEVFYVDDLGNTKTFKLSPITLTVTHAKPVYEALPGRVATGTAEVDRLLLGGIPEGYAVVLAAPSSDERQQLINRFLETGAEAGETTFYITTGAGNGNALAEKYPSNFYLFVCNLQADAVVQDSPNVFKLKGVENLTDIDIALTKALRKLSSTETGTKRICIEILSDILLQHHAVNTRRWMSALLATLKSKGFTILAVVDSMWHPPEELQAVLGVFDGEIRVTQKETPEGIRQTLRVRKLVNQKYRENEVPLTREKLSS